MSTEQDQQSDDIRAERVYYERQQAEELEVLDAVTKDAPPKPDFTVDNHGSIFILTPNTESAQEKAQEIGDDETQHWGTGIVVEPRYIGEIVERLQEEGFTISVSCP
jgi:hypothetical protein